METALLKKKFSKFGSSIKKRLIIANDSYTNLEELVKKYKIQPIKGILFDLGLSTWHLKESGRGFSFQKNEPLDMRYDFQNPERAEKILNYRSAAEIEKILRDLGEEPFAEKIAKNIVQARSFKPIKKTFQLVEIIKNSVPGWYKRQQKNVATRTFQALRIAVNDELSSLEKTLPQALKILSKGGRLAVISFHSLEDRIVKNFFLSKESNELKNFDKKTSHTIKKRD